MSPSATRGRWSAISGSANIEAGFQLQLSKDAADFHTFICVCSAPFGGRDDDSDDDDEEEDEWEDADSDDEMGSGDEMDETDESDDKPSEAKKKKKAPCTGGKTCMCRKPAAEHPEHPWVMSQGGEQKFLGACNHASLRDPDNFSMYTWNDHAGQGVMEVVQNLVLDFQDAAGSADWREQWMVCEAMAYFLLSPHSEQMVMTDDPDSLQELLGLVGRTFLSMLARFERERQLSDASDVKNLGRIMALYLKFTNEVRANELFEDAEAAAEVGYNLDGRDAKSGSFQYQAFDNYVLAYADKFGITLLGPEDIDDIAAECDGTVELPVASETNADPWNLTLAVNKYRADHGTQKREKGKPTIGGDKLDLTAWSSAERAGHSYTGKDPLGKRERDALKQGMVMHLG